MEAGSWGDSKASYSEKGHFRTWLVYWLIV